MVRVNLVARDNGVGLSSDLRLLASILGAAGIESRIQPMLGRGKLRKWFGPSIRRANIELRRLLHKPSYDINLMLEHIRPEILRAARINLFIPNPEWCLPEDIEYLSKFDQVLTKTAHAQELFSERGCNAAFIGFTSNDCLDASVPRKREFFHLAGRSEAKRTQAVMEAWLRHPEWPTLTVVQNPRSAGNKQFHADNIVHRVDYVGVEELRQMQNSHLFHLCPSETEGFGHYLMEALSVGAVVMTTDAEPMNELVTAERGLLIPYATTATQHLATCYLVDVAGIEAGVQAALALDEARIAELSTAARAYYLRNDAEFRERLPRVILAALASH